MLGIGQESVEVGEHLIDVDLSIKEDRKDRPSVFDYADFRSFLKDMLEYKKSLNPSFSENAFIFAAGFGKNSRGYFGLLMKNKRNLTTKSIMGFSQAMSLTAEEAIYFENMVLFNQASTEQERIMFFERMKVGAKGKKARLVSVLEHQYRFMNEWHLTVLKEVILLADFKEDPVWISARLGHKVSPEKIAQGLNDLLALNMITRDESGKLVPCEEIVFFKDNAQNFTSSKNIHKQFALRAAEAIELPYEKRGAQLITLCLPQARFEELRKEMQEFTKRILQEYPASKKEPNDLIVQLGMQLIKITE